MMDFTRDELNLMMLYSPGTRSGLCEALLQMKEQLAEDFEEDSEKFLHNIFRLS